MRGKEGQFLRIFTDLATDLNWGYNPALPASTLRRIAPGFAL
jgi:hypothetical protein